MQHAFDITSAFISASLEEQVKLRQILLLVHFTNAKTYPPQFQGFTDIEFNPKKTINCQAYAAALFVSLSKRGILHNAIHSRDNFLACLANQQLSNAREDHSVQPTLF